MAMAVWCSLLSRTRSKASLSLQISATIACGPQANSGSVRAMQADLILCPAFGSYFIGLERGFDPTLRFI